MDKSRRSAFIERKTKETEISLSLDLDGTGSGEIDTGIGFFNHMLELFKKHALVDLIVKCVGDLDVDYHHTVEDVAIVLGRAFSQTLGDKRGINRYGSAVIPMDEALILAAADLSGRAYLGFELSLAAQKVGDFDTELVKEFFAAFVRASGCTLHIRELAGENTHHVIEGACNSFARTMRSAAAMDPEAEGEIPSTKGVL